MSTIQDAVDWWAAQALTVTGVLAATSTPDEAFGTNNVAFIAYDSAGVLTADAANQGRDLYTLQGLLIIPRGDLKSALLTLRGLPVLIANKIRSDPTFGGTVQTYEQITYQFAPALQWQGVDSVGYILTVTGVKIRPVV